MVVVLHRTAGVGTASAPLPRRSLRLPVAERAPRPAEPGHINVFSPGHTSKQLVTTGHVPDVLRGQRVAAAAQLLLLLLLLLL